MKKPIPKGKKGKGIKALKKKAPEVAKRMGYKKGGSVKKNTKRMNRLEELGRVDSEKAYSKKGKKNLKAEKKRIVRELKKG